MTSLYRENAQSLGTCISVLHFPIVIFSKKAFIGPIFNMTDSSLPVQMEWVLKGSGASKYEEIGPNFDLIEHYIHMLDGKLSQVISNPMVNRLYQMHHKSCAFAHIKALHCICLHELYTLLLYQFDVAIKGEAHVGNTYMKLILYWISWVINDSWCIC